MGIMQPVNFEPYLSRWQLCVDGEAILTHSSQLLPVRYQNQAAMLKISTSAEERWGASLMVWWNGQGAARVFQHEKDALLMERAQEKSSLLTMVSSDQDDEASRIICSVVAQLHGQHKSPPKLLALSDWFRSLEAAASQLGGMFKQSYAVAKELLDSPEDVVVLHGDIHHGNILDFGSRGWLAIDPKHLQGERGYDYANLFCNPDQIIATRPGRLLQQLQIVAEAAQLNKQRLLKWIFAYAGLSAAWSLEDKQSAELALAVAEIAANLLPQ
ncbi:aminoglycoside phosphotransferase family protein [Legionella massiliensis]|nr:aminoglycoside phosphotransferase family protein [Legionella massiliensis]